MPWQQKRPHILQVQQGEYKMSVEQVQMEMVSRPVTLT